MKFVTLLLIQLLAVSCSHMGMMTPWSNANDVQRAADMDDDKPKKPDYALGYTPPAPKPAGQAPAAGQQPQQVTIKPEEYYQAYGTYNGMRNGPGGFGGGNTTQQMYYRQGGNRLRP